jgi:hypothetical protein
MYNFERIMLTVMTFNLWAIFAVLRYFQSEDSKTRFILPKT